MDIVKPHKGKVDIRQKRDDLSSWFPDLKDNRKLDKSQGYFHIESSSSSFSCLQPYRYDLSLSAPDDQGLVQSIDILKIRT